MRIAVAMSALFIASTLASDLGSDDVNGYNEDARAKICKDLRVTDRSAKHPSWHRQSLLITCKLNGLDPVWQGYDPSAAAGFSMI